MSHFQIKVYILITPLWFPFIYFCLSFIALIKSQLKQVENENSLTEVALKQFSGRYFTSVPYYVCFYPSLISILPHHWYFYLNTTNLSLHFHNLEHLC